MASADGSPPANDKDMAVIEMNPIPAAESANGTSQLAASATLGTLGSTPASTSSSVAAPSNSQLATTERSEKKLFVPFVDVEFPQRRGTYLLKTLDPTKKREPFPVPGDSSDAATSVPRSKIHLFAQDPQVAGNEGNYEDDGKLLVEKAMEGNEDVKFDPYATFRFMMMRRWQRFKDGEWSASKGSSHIWTLLFFFIMFLFIATAIVQGVAAKNGLTGIDNDATQSAIQRWAFGVLIIVVLPWVLIGNNTSSIVKVMFFTIDLYVLATFILNLVYLFRNVPPAQVAVDPAYNITTAVLTGILVAALVVEFLVWLFLQKILPWMLETGKIDDKWTQLIWQMEEVHDRPRWTWKYRTGEGWGRRVERFITYRGEVDPKTGRPHGLGEWLDDAIQGEALFGNFIDGIPTAPYNSTVYSSGSAFSATRIGFFRNNAAKWDAGHLDPRRDPKGCTVGVAAVECSVAGKFQKNLPEVRLVMEPEYVSDERATVKMLRNLGQGIPEVYGEEAVIYIHGLWNTAETALDEIGQFRSLGAYPKNLKWFIFDWPSGWYPWASFFAVRKVSKSQGVKEDLRDFVRLLSKNGFKKLHFIGHSMGSRVLSHLSEFMTELFQPLPESGLPTDSSLPICGSLTFIHGEMDLVDFITIKYPIFRQYCNLMTAYTDSADQALLLAEVLTGRLMMGKNPEAFFVDPFAKNLGVEQGDLDVVKEARGEYLNLLENRERGSIGRLRKRSTTEQTEIDGLRKTQLADLRSSDGVGASTAVSVPLASSSSEDPKFKRNTKWREISKLDKEHVKMWLDMDVIDNSFLDTNTGAVRHSIFVLNKSLIDDIQDIILHGKRAHQRGQRLLRRVGNSWYFLVAPSFMGI